MVSEFLLEEFYISVVSKNFYDETKIYSHRCHDKVIFNFES